MSNEIYAQGDIIIERVKDAEFSEEKAVSPDPDGALVLARGEATGHRHAFYSRNVAMFRDDALAYDMPKELYVGHVVVSKRPAKLQHEEHGTIVLEPGSYRIRRQREYDAIEMARLVAD